MKKLIITSALLFFILTAFGQEAIHIEKTGKGTPIIFLPGFTSPGAVWHETINRLTGKYESHVVSYAGFNGLEPIGTPWYNPIVDELVAYIKMEKLSNLTIIGHSMGGNVAIDVAAALPNQVKNLILVESIPCMRELMMPGVPASSLQYDSPYNQQILNMPDEAFTQMAAGMAQNMTFDSTKIDLLTKWSLEADRETYVYGYTDLLKLDLRDKLSAVQAKTLILGASHLDKNLIQSNYEKQYTHLANKEILIADNSKHFIMFDQPEWLYDNINNFLKSNGR